MIMAVTDRTLHVHGTEPSRGQADMDLTVGGMWVLEMGLGKWL